MKSYDIFGLSHGSGENEESEKKTVSYFVNKVANGNERRTASLVGSYVLDLKLYHVNDIQNTESKDVWRKALVRVKVQTQDDTELWKSLQKLVTSIDKNFLDEPQFYSDKISLK